MGIVRAQYSKCHPRHFFFSRSSVGKIGEGIREVKEMVILIKSTFSVWEFLGSSLVHPWFLLGLLPEGNREGTKVGNLNKTPFVLENTNGD